MSCSCFCLSSITGSGCISNNDNKKERKRTDGDDKRGEGVTTDHTTIVHDVLWCDLAIFKVYFMLTR
jgi:hypothetical protein